MRQIQNVTVTALCSDDSGPFFRLVVWTPGSCFFHVYHSVTLSPEVAVFPFYGNAFGDPPNYAQAVKKMVEYLEEQ